MNYLKTDIKFHIAVAILCLCNLFVYKNILATPTITHAFTREFPSRISNWTGDDVVYDEEVLSSLASDRIVYKSYYRNGSPPVTLFMACYDTLEKADLSHSPIVCFTGQGWSISETGKKELPVNSSDTPSIKVNELTQEKLDATMITLFWYQSVNRAFSNRGAQKIYLFFDKLFGKQDQNAFVRITVSVPHGKTITETTSHMYSFVRDLYPELRRFFLEHQREFH